jgi:predicted nucleic acid-binding protein
MTASVLIDTNVIIDYLRGKQAAITFINSLADQPATSVVVVAELYAGVRDGRERTQLEALLRMTTIYSLSQTAAVQGGLFRRQYGKSHNVGLEDSLIAATALAEGVTLVTLNGKHFPMLPNVLVPYITAP